MGEKNQIIKNLIFNIFNLVVSGLIGFLYTPYLIKNLGVIAYGIIPLAMVINQYVSIFSSSLTNTLTRFYSVAYQQGNFKDASKYLTSSFVAVIILVVFIGIVAFILTINFNMIINVPANLLSDAKLLFIYILISLCISLLSSFLNITLYAKNRLDYMNLISLVRSFTKVIFVVVFFHLIEVNLRVIGIAGIVSEILVLILSLIYFKNTITREISIRYKYFNLQFLSPIIIMALWLIVHQVGDLGIYKIDLLIVNKFWSAKETGYLGAFSDFGSYMMSLMGVITSLFGPIILIAFSNNNHERIKQFIVEISFLVAILSTIFIGLLIGFAHPFITLWVGKEFSTYYYWFILKLVSLPFYASAGVFSFVYRSWNFVKAPAITTLVLGIINISILYILAKMSNRNIYYIEYILIVSCITTFIQTYVLGVVMMKLTYKDVKLFDYAKNTFLIILTLICIVLFCHLGSNWVTISSWTDLLTMTVVVGLISLVLIYFAILNKNHRRLIFKMLQR